MREYLNEITAILNRIENENPENLALASDAVADVICNDALIYIFGYRTLPSRRARHLLPCGRVGVRVAASRRGSRCSMMAARSRAAWRRYRALARRPFATR